MMPQTRKTMLNSILKSKYCPMWSRFFLKLLCTEIAITYPKTYTPATSQTKLMTHYTHKNQNKIPMIFKNNMLAWENRCPLKKMAIHILDQILESNCYEYYLLDNIKMWTRTRQAAITLTDQTDYTKNRPIDKHS